MTISTKYETEDGQVFTSLEAAEEHNEHLMKRKELIAFEDALIKKGVTPRAAKARANAAYEYLVWIETGYIKQREQHDQDEEAASRDLGAVA